MSAAYAEERSLKRSNCVTIRESNHGPELLLATRRTPGAPPLSIQIEHGLRAAIRDGRLSTGDRLPPTRTLAADLGVSRRVVVEAFDQLAAEGWLDARVGAGTFVRGGLGPRAGRRQPRRGPAAAPRDTGTGAQSRLRYDFFPGHPDLSAFPRSAWARLTREVMRELPDRELGYGDPRGLRELRVALAAMLARTRGVVCRPGQIVICQGAVQALGLLVRARGAAPRVAVEDPYLPEHRTILLAAGAELVPVPVDRLGVRDAAVVAADCGAALLTPAHQMPTGAVLAAGRRAALARWAQEHDALLIEDDYDAEYRHRRAPTAAMQALAPSHTAYLGSASKTLAPGLRLGWLVVPEARLEPVVEAKRLADGGSPVIEQAVFTRLITSGLYDRHVRAARRIQAERRRALADAVATHAPRTRIEGNAAGLHVLLRLPGPVDAAEVVRRARERGVGVYPLSGWSADPPAETYALVMGYGSLTPAAVVEGVRRLGAALEPLT